MLRIVTGSEMREIDRIAIEERGIPGLKLMEEAGRQVALRAQSLLQKTGERNVLVIAGTGNNGGDGLVAARYLHEVGIPVRVFLLDDGRLSKDAGVQYERLRKLLDAEIIADKKPQELQKAAEDADVIIDAIFGTGFKGVPEGKAKQAIETANGSGNPVIAVDIPSGVEGDTGRVGGAAIEASETVTFGLPKLGCVLHPGASYCGDLLVVDIGFPSDVIGRPSDAYLLEAFDAAGRLPPRAPDTHKKECGTVFVVAGSRGMTGAAAMTSEAALRSGAGVVTLAIPGNLNDIMEVKLTEVMTYPVSGTPRGTLAKEAHGEIMRGAAGFDVMALGPGLSGDAETIHTVRKLLEEADMPVVLDADGLNAIAGDAELLKKRGGPTVITPHAGELARLAGTTAAEVENDRMISARKAAAEWSVTVVLKGNRSLIASPDGTVYVSPTGNPGMATAGTGDVLTGIIAGFWAQGMDALDAAMLGTYVHGTAGDLAVQELNRYSLIATDLIEYLPYAINALEEAVEDIGHPELEAEE